MMTCGTGKRRMLLTRVQKLRIIKIVTLRKDGPGKGKKEKGKNEDVKPGAHRSFLSALFPFYFFRLPCSLRCRIMTRWRFLFADIRRVAIGATATLLPLLKLFFDCRDPGISRLFIVLVTSRADRNRNIRCEIS